MRSFFFFFFFFAVGCAHQTELTAAENRNEAAIHQAKAAQEQAKYDPNESKSQVRPVGPQGIDHLSPEFSYNPTAEHQVAADKELRAAAAFLAAAHKLETFEDLDCKDIAPAQRSACPLLASSVIEVRHTSRGFQLVMKPSVDVADTQRRLKCHLSYARSIGFERPSCPLFVKGMDLHRVGEDVIEFEGNSPAVATELRKQASRIFGGVAQTFPITSL